MSWLILYNLMSAGFDVFVGASLQVDDPVLSVMLATAWVSVLSAVAMPILGERVTAWPTGGWRAWVGLQISSAVCWATLFFAMRDLEPAVCGAIAFGVTPLITLGVERFSATTRAMGSPSRRAPSGTRLPIALVILLALVEMAWVSFSGDSAVGDQSFGQIANAVGLSVVCGASMVGCLIFSRRLADEGWSIPRIMSTRFLLLILVAAAVGGHQVPMTSLAAHLRFFITGVVGIGLPLVVFQIGVKKVSPWTVAVVAATQPLVTWVLQAFDPRLEMSPASLIGIALLCAALAASEILSRRPGQGGHAT